MANLFTVGTQVICQKKGGQSGSKPTSPAFHGVVESVLPGGLTYKVKMETSGLVHIADSHFKGGVVAENFMINA